MTLNVLNRVKFFFKEIWIESKKVDWPNRETTLKYTAVVIGISLAMAAFLGILDFVFLKILGRFIV